MRMIGLMWRAVSRGMSGRWTAAFLAIAIVSAAAPVAAQDLSDNPKYSAIVVDAQSGEVFYARRADSARYPASLTKIMTLYMAFDALARGQLKPTDQIVISERAASQAPVKVYLKPGDTIDVDTAMRLIALYSANDLAVALSEKIGGTEERFAALMTIRAQELGMTQTRFVNANGLPDPRQLSSARDLAILARAVMRDYPQYYGYFNIESMEYRGHTYLNHNPLHGLPGVDGMKTGYTGAAGYNLVASQVRDGHRLIAVMLGGSSKSQRREHVTELMNTGFDVIDRREHGELIAVAQDQFTHDDNDMSAPAGAAPYTILARNDDNSADQDLRNALNASDDEAGGDDDVQRLSAKVSAPAVVATLTQTQAPAPAATPVKTDDQPVRAAKGRKTVVLADNDDDTPAKGKKGRKKNPDAVWSVQVGAFKDKGSANDWLRNIQKRFDEALADASSQVTKNDNGWYRTRFAELTKEQAQKACRSMSAKRLDCMVIKPDA